LAADVVGYSRLVQRDEQGTLDRLKAHRKELVEPVVTEHGGRIVKLMGDGILCEFPSAVHAVACAVAVQGGMAEREVAVPEADRIRFRIGINVGDVVHEGGDILGDGVNVAARLEALAEPGGVLLARNVHNQIKDKLAIRFEPAGRHRVKNIAEPVEVWRVAPGEAAARTARRRSLRLRPVYAAAAALAFLLLLVAGAAGWWWYDLRGLDEAGAPPFAGKPSVAVLPFDNLSGEAEDVYFADGMTDDLITDLAKVSGLAVIARNSVFAYKGRPVAAQEVARELRVRYVVEGSVRRAGGRVRINAQLIDATTGGHLWADRFERSAADVFAVQDEVIGRIIAALAVELTPAEQAQLARPPTRNLEAYDYFLRAEQAAKSGHQSELREALALYERATALDPTFADAFAAHARTAVYIWSNDLDVPLPTPVARKTAYEMAGRALELDAQAPLPYAVLAVLQVVDRRYEEALASARRAVELGPGNAEVHAALALVLTYVGDHAGAVAAVERSLRLDPNPPTGDRLTAALAFTLHDDHARAIELLERGRALAPTVDDIPFTLAVAYARAGRLEDARAATADALRLNPRRNIEYQRLMYAHFRDGRDLALVLDAFREAGLPQWPYGFRGDERDRLTGEEISRLALGRTWQGQTGEGDPAFLHIGSDGRTALRTPTQIATGTAFIEEDLLCERSESVALGRARCGPVYRHLRGPGEDGPGYTYVNVEKVLHFSPVK
jgi:TolB-like protein/class 3 adenylate cyclase/Flp pilus assembly protein TadD